MVEARSHRKDNVLVGCSLLLRAESANTILLVFLFLPETTTSFPHFVQFGHERYRTILIVRHVISAMSSSSPPPYLTEAPNISIHIPNSPLQLLLTWEHGSATRRLAKYFPESL